MNDFTALLCLAPLAVGVGIPALYVFSLIRNAALKAAKRDLQEQARERALQVREAAALRAAQLHEAKLARENNLVVLQDAKLEIEKLKLKELEYKTRHMNPRLNFEANDYQDPPTS